MKKQLQEVQYVRQDPSRVHEMEVLKRNPISQERSETRDKITNILGKYLKKGKDILGMVAAVIFLLAFLGIISITDSISGPRDPSRRKKN